MDEIDVQILQCLAEDARASIERIAERVGLSPTPVRRRLRRLEETGVVRRYTIDLDLEKCGLTLTAYVSVRLAQRDHGTIDRFEERVRAIPQVSRCALVTGPVDYILTVHARDMAAYNELMRSKLSQLPGVFGLETSISINEVKSTPPQPDATGSAG